MKKINRDKGACAQGDCLIIPVESIPKEARAQPGAKRLIIAHSETGHDHVIDMAQVGQAKLFISGNPMICYLHAERSVDLVHLRPWDTHETLRLPPGDYAIYRQREGTPEGWRRVED